MVKACFFFIYGFCFIGTFAQSFDTLSYRNKKYFRDFVASANMSHTHICARASFQILNDSLLSYIKRNSLKLERFEQRENINEFEIKGSIVKPVLDIDTLEYSLIVKLSKHPTIRSYMILVFVKRLVSNDRRMEIKELSMETQYRLYLYIGKELATRKYLSDLNAFSYSALDKIKSYSFHSRYLSKEQEKKSQKDTTIMSDKMFAASWKLYSALREDSKIIDVDLEIVKRKYLDILNRKHIDSRPFCYVPNHFMRLYDEKGELLSEVDIAVNCGDLIETQNKLFSYKYLGSSVLLENVDDGFIQSMKNAGIKRFE